MNTNKTKIIVLGKNGQLARSLYELSKLKKLDINFLSSKEIDLTYPEKLEQALEKTHYDVLINTAAYTLVDKAEAEKERAFAINALSVKRLAEISKDRNAKMIHFSTDYVYSDMSDNYLTEKSKTNPLNQYGLTKLQGENYIVGSKVRHLIFRTSWVFSPWGTNFLKTMLKLGAEKEELKIVSDQIGSPTYAPDLAEAVLSILDRWSDLDQDGIYNLAGRTVCSWYDFAHQIFSKAAALDYNLKIKNLIAIPSIEFPTAAVRPLNSRLDQGKAVRTFNVQLSELAPVLADCLRRIKEES